MIVVVWDYISCVCFVKSLCKGTNINKMKKKKKKKTRKFKRMGYYLICVNT